MLASSWSVLSLLASSNDEKLGTRITAAPVPKSEASLPMSGRRPSMLTLYLSPGFSLMTSFDDHFGASGAAKAAWRLWASKAVFCW